MPMHPHAYFYEILFIFSGFDRLAQPLLQALAGTDIFFRFKGLIMQEQAMVVSRRKVLNWIGVTAGAAAMYQAMSALSFAAESTYERNFALSGAPKGTRVLILGAGLAGMTAAYELRKAGYQVKLDYIPRGTDERYLRLNYAVATGPFTAGTIKAGVVWGGHQTNG